MHRIALLVTAALLAAGPAVAQRFWVSAAAGPGTPNDLSVITSTAVRFDRIVLRARYALNGEYAGDMMQDVGIVVGAVVTSPAARRGQLAVGAGVGRAMCHYCGYVATQPDPAPTTGFLVEAEGRVTLATGLGVSVYAFGDFNSTQTFGGVALGLFIGRL